MKEMDMLGGLWGRIGLECSVGISVVCSTFVEVLTCQKSGPRFVASILLNDAGCDGNTSNNKDPVAVHIHLQIMRMMTVMMMIMMTFTLDVMIIMVSTMMTMMMMMMTMMMMMMMITAQCPASGIGICFIPGFEESPDSPAQLQYFYFYFYTSISNVLIIIIR